jgi:hypothetical protein
VSIANAGGIAGVRTFFQLYSLGDHPLEEHFGLERVRFKTYLAVVIGGLLLPTNVTARKNVSPSDQGRPS